MTPIVIFDIDGTLADCSERRKQLAIDGDYEKFYNKINNDKPKKPIVDLCVTLRQSGDYKIYILTGRKEKLRKETIDWLTYKAKIGWEEDYTLLMRADDDNRPDEIVKAEMVKYFKDQISFVVDDRRKVVDMWRSMGITCLQCEDFTA